METKNYLETLSISGTDENSVRRISEFKFDLLQLVNGGEIWHDLRFLIPFKNNIKKLRVSGIFNGFLGLEMLSELTQLDLEDYPPLPVVDLSSLIELRICKMGWSPKIFGERFFSIPVLEEISITRYRGVNCVEIGLAKKLRHLKLRHGKLESLNGIEGCSLLEEMRFIKVTGLTSLDGIAACKALRVIEIEKGSVIENIAESFFGCSNLTEVFLEGDFEIANLSWIEKNPNMTKFRADAVVLNIDWHKLFGAPKLDEIAFRHIPNALCSDDEIKDIAKSQGKKIQWIEHGGIRRLPWVEIHFAI
ncbi:hypothetical protein ACO0LG_12070 [Undibacterium sp. Ji42W]|uniref:hypothetical protein n=1 Tax=Undibacterium sp. Ji42W TaxID=3413039 RepID=UPI003BF05E55